MYSVYKDWTAIIIVYDSMAQNKDPIKQGPIQTTKVYISNLFICLYQIDTNKNLFKWKFL